MFSDNITIYIKSGDGGDGCTSFYTEKYIAKGGPDGGDGGNGGDVVFVADAQKSSLIDYNRNSRHRAGNGEKGMPRFCAGKRGEDLVIRVPLGTVIRDVETGNVMADLTQNDMRVVIMRGGSGGKGNSRFKSSRRRTPRFSQSGEKTQYKQVALELKIIADVGIIGFPNAGKSTLLSVISAAKPKIGDYAFTTLSPNLGVVRHGYSSFTAADIPGLIEGAAHGQGLGHQFLRHIGRTRLLIHVIDISAEGSAADNYKIILNELKSYSPALAKLKQVIALNKCELLEPDELDRRVSEFKAAVKKHKKVVISAAAHINIDTLVKTVFGQLAEIPVPPVMSDFYEYPKRDTEQYEIVRDDDGAFVVIGGLVDELSRNIVLDDMESLGYMQKRLRECGVFSELLKRGASNGSTVRILDTEFEYCD